MRSGYVVLAVLAVVVAFAAGWYLAYDDGEDGQSEVVVPEKVRLEYKLDVIERPGNTWDINLSFSAPEYGRCYLFIGDSPLLNNGGTQVTASWDAGNVIRSWGFDESAYTYEYAKANIWVQFSSNFDAVRIS